MPPNTTATLQPPDAHFEGLEVNGVPVSEAEGVQQVLSEKGQLLMASGSYRLTYRLRN